MAFHDKFYRRHGRFPNESEIQKEAKERADGLKIVAIICLLSTAFDAVRAAEDDCGEDPCHAPCYHQCDVALKANVQPK